MFDPLTTKDVLRVITETEKLLHDLLSKIDWDIEGGAENNHNFDLKVRTETCYDNVAYAKKNAEDWLT